MGFGLGAPREKQREEGGVQAVRGTVGGGGSDRRQTRGHDVGGVRSVRQGTAAHGPAGRRAGTWATATVGSVQKNSNLFDLFKEISKRNDLI
jgi:hypothetical protein